jgi:hypothetical protein
MVVLQTVVWDCTIATAQCYTMAMAQVIRLHVQLAPYMYLQSFISSSPRLYSPFLCVQLTYKSYKMCSSVLYDISMLGGNDKDHSYMFCESHTMVLLKLKGLGYLLQYTSKIMDIHSCDDLVSCTLYTRHLLFSHFLCFDSTIMLSSSNISSSLP